MFTCRPCPTSTRTTTLRTVLSRIVANSIRHTSTISPTPSTIHPKPYYTVHPPSENWNIQIHKTKLPELVKLLWTSDALRAAVPVPAFKHSKEELEAGLTQLNLQWWVPQVVAGQDSVIGKAVKEMGGKILYLPIREGASAGEKGEVEEVPTQHLKVRLGWRMGVRRVYDDLSALHGVKDIRELVVIVGLWPLSGSLG